MKTKVILETTRQGYDTSQCGHTLRVRDVIELLQGMDEDAEVFFSNDNGYTYGALNWDTIQEVAEEEEEEE